MHFNIQADESNQNEDGRIGNESSKDNKTELMNEGKNPEEKGTKGMTEDKRSEVSNAESVNQGELDSLQEPQEEYEIIEREILPEKIICPDCGGITLEGLDFCDQCGGELHIYNR
jgi:hypothetical protein